MNGNQYWPAYHPKQSSCLNSQHTRSLVTLFAQTGVQHNLWYSYDAKLWHRRIRGWLKEQCSRCFVVTNHHAQVIAFIRVKRWKHEKRKHCAWVGPVAVHPDYWRNGHATALVGEIISLCRHSNVRRLEIAIPADARAMLSLATNEGFLKEGAQKRALLRDDGSYADLILMTKHMRPQK